MGEVWRIVSGKDGGSGSFLCPPGHPALTHSVYGWFSSGTGKPNTRRPSGPNVIGGVGDLAELEESDYPAGIKAGIRRLFDSATLVCSPDWVANVYGYFRNSYSPDGTDRNVSNAISYKPGICTRCGFTDARGPHKANAPAAHQPYRRRNPTPEQAAEYEERLSAATWHRFKPPAGPPAPETHLGYLAVRSYFPEHEPNLELIAGRGLMYGQRECIHCGQACQYEARWDAWAPFGQTPVCLAEDRAPNGWHEIARED